MQGEHQCGRCSAVTLLFYHVSLESSSTLADTRCRPALVCVCVCVCVLELYDCRPTLHSHVVQEGPADHNQGNQLDPTVKTDAFESFQ